jgi:erythromycin esterase-like protein
MDYIGDSKYVLLGESLSRLLSTIHGAKKITQRLIREKGFSFVGVEGDWQDYIA